MTDAKALVAKVRELSEKATKGYWASDWGRVRDDNCGTICEHPSADNAFGPKWEANKNLIATYRTAAPQLADMLEAESERADTAERRLEIALRAIEERPHEITCKWVNPDFLSTEEITDDTYRCTCWKSRVAAQLNTP